MIHIAIIEPSHVIYEGLANVLLRSEHHFRVYRLENIEELEHPGLKEKIDVVVLNPVQIQNNTRHFIQLKRTSAQFKWTGLIYSYFDKETLSVFDSLGCSTGVGKYFQRTDYRAGARSAYSIGSWTFEQGNCRQTQYQYTYRC